LTESAAMADQERAAPLLHELRATGVCLAIDDFGAGHSSLGRLRDLPVDVIKVDRAFLRSIPEDPTACAIVEAIVELTRAVGMDAVAEGIETDAQRDFITRAGCRLGQGYGLGRPCPAAELDGLLDALV